MTEEITASASLDISTYLLAFKWARRSKRFMRRLMYGVVFGCCGLVLWLGMSDGDVTFSDVLTPLLIPCALAYYIYRARDVNLVSQQIKQLSSYGNLSSWSITQDGYGAAIGEARAFVPWTDVHKTLATPDGTLIYLQKDAFEWLPKHAFSTDADYTRFLTLVTAKTKHSKIG